MFLFQAMSTITLTNTAEKFTFLVTRNRTLERSRTLGRQMIGVIMMNMFYRRSPWKTYERIRFLIDTRSHQILIPRALVIANEKYLRADSLLPDWWRLKSTLQLYFISDCGPAAPSIGPEYVFPGAPAPTVCVSYSNFIGVIGCAVAPKGEPGKSFCN